jgi:hypothetical protein
MKKILIHSICILLCIYTKAQEAATNSGNLQIHSGGSVAIFGDFTNASSATLVNDGSVYLKNTLTNNQTSMSVGTGTLYLNGSSAQSVAGTTIFKTYNLNTDNAAGITLNNNLSISSTHTFTSGDIASSLTPNYLIYESGSSYTGATDARHVTGWVKKIGNTGFIFPTGNGTYLRQIETSNLSTSIEFNAKYRGTTQNTNNLQSPLVVINPNEYWTLDNITQSGTTAQVTLNWDNSKVAFPEYVLADLRSAQYNASNLWESTGGSATGSVTTTGSITSNSLSAFGSLSIGSITFTVPLNFLSIIAQRKTDYTLVEWKTANEANVKHHEIQRSKGNNIFTTIAIQPARNIIDKQTYNHNDFDKLEGTIYYRIKSVDFDGKTKYSKVVSVNYAGISETISVRNNPVAAATIYLSLSSVKNKPYNYQLIAANGNIVQQGNLQYGGTGSMSISLQSSVISGSYILVLNDGVKISTHKIIVQ